MPRPGNRSKYRYLVLAVTAAAVLAVACPGCGGGGKAGNEKEYKARWTDIMDTFDQRVVKDDKRAEEFVAKNDISGLINLVNRRVDDIDEVFGQVLELYPPEDLRKLHAVTLYYLINMRDQLVAQNILNEAALSGKPTEDLKKIADDEAARTQMTARELGIELQRKGIMLKSVKEEAGKKDTAPEPPKQDDEKE
ncbi:MAG: hypothetical protein L6427_12885 [Actinomycetia bacterium]|nr:hypothetical protein [Actinomycetes bacterium]